MTISNNSDEFTDEQIEEKRLAILGHIQEIKIKLAELGLVLAYTVVYMELEEEANALMNVVFKEIMRADLDEC